MTEHGVFGLGVDSFFLHIIALKDSSWTYKGLKNGSVSKSKLNF